LKRVLLLGSCIASGLLAMGCKEMAVTLPFFIFLYEWFFFQQTSWAWLRRSGWFAVILLAVVLGIGLVGFRYMPLQIIEAGYAKYDFSLGQRLLTEARVVLYYLSLLVFPHPSRLKLDYEFPLSLSLVNPPTTILSLTVLWGLAVLAIYLAVKDRLLSYCIIWFFGNLVIESSIIPLDIYFEHRVYLPSMLAVLFGVVAAARYLPRKSVKIALCGLVVITSSIWTWERNIVWSDPIKVFIDSAQKSPANARPFYNAACEYARRNDAQAAVYWLKQSIEKKNFTRWDLIKNDPDLDNIRDSDAFKAFYGYVFHGQDG
jgi:hypothetical protein